MARKAASVSWVLGLGQFYCFLWRDPSTNHVPYIEIAQVPSMKIRKCNTHGHQVLTRIIFSL